MCKYIHTPNSKMADNCYLALDASFPRCSAQFISSYRHFRIYFIYSFYLFRLYVWDESFFLPKIPKMSMSFAFITFTVFTSLQINVYAYVSFSKESAKESSGTEKQITKSFIAINLYHSTFLRNADPDLDENSGGSTDLHQKIARIGGFSYPYSPLSLSRP